MALINQAFRIGLSASKTVILLGATGTVGTAKAASNATLNAIVKGSADQASRGDVDVTVEEQFTASIDVNEPRLIGTAAIGGSVYGMITLRFYRKLQLANRLALASDLIARVAKSTKVIETRMILIAGIGDDIQKGMSVTEYELKIRTLTTQNALIQAERRQMDAFVLMLEGLNDVNVEQIVRQNKLTATTRKELTAVRSLITASNVKGLTDTELGALKQLFDPKDALGMKTTLNSLASYLDTLDTAIRSSQVVQNSASGLLTQRPGGATARIPSSATIKAMGMKIQGVESFNVSQTASALTENGLDKRISNISQASDDLAKLSKGSIVGRVAGKALLVDSIIWGVSLGIDLSLNLFLTEKQQGDIPIIGFLFKGAGWSPIGAVIEGVIDFFVEPETKQTLFDIFLATLVAASQVELLEDAVLMILNFYIDEVSGELLVPLEFGQDINQDGGLLTLMSADPLRILELFTYAIIAKIVVKAWIMPSVGFLGRQLSYA